MRGIPFQWRAAAVPFRRTGYLAKELSWPRFPHRRHLDYRQALVLGIGARANCHARACGGTEAGGEVDQADVCAAVDPRDDADAADADGRDEGCDCGDGEGRVFGAGMGRMRII